MMVALFGLREGSDTSSRASTCLLKPLGFGKLSAIHCSTRTDTELLGALDQANPGSLWRRSLWRISGSESAQQLRTRCPQGSPSGIPADANSGVFGGRLTYYPTPYWTLIASVDETLGMSTFPTFVTPAGIPNLATTAILQTTYGLSRQWSIGARVGYTRADYIGFDRLDNGWLAGASFNYEIWRNLALTLDYQYSKVHSNVAVLRFYAQSVHCRPYIQVLSEMVLMFGAERKWTKELGGSAGVSHV